MLRKIYLTILIIFIIMIIANYFINQSSNLPGIKVNDIGNKHVPTGTIVKYNSNPPTSGDHYEQWLKAGIYDQPLQDEQMVHSLEHGYVIISYNCDIPQDTQGFTFSKVLAHEEEVVYDSTTSSNLIDPLFVEIWKNWQKDSNCHQLIDNLKEIVTNYNTWKIILVPRPKLDARIALTAWTRLDKFDNYDLVRIRRFIQAYRDRGPEQTPD